MGQRRLTEGEQACLRYVHERLKGLKNGGVEVDCAISNLKRILENDTTDGLPYIEPELTLEDVKNKTWVMVKDWNETNHIGPYRLAATSKSESNKYVVLEPDYSWGGSWSFARRATREEIEAAGLMTPEEMAKVKWFEVAG
jgi:hypothetical protein